MGLLDRFRRSSTPELSQLDALTLDELGKVTDLRQPREWIHYLAGTDETAAHDAASRIAEAGWTIDRIGKAAADDEWIIVAKRDDVVVTPKRVIDARLFFEDVAGSMPGGLYDGWEASA